MEVYFLLSVPKKDSKSLIIYPLETNIDWFQSKQQKLTLEANIKHNLLLYDELYFESGTLEVTAVTGEQGGVTMMSHPWSKGTEGGFEYVEKSPVGEEFTTAVELPGGKYMPVVQGKISRYYKADFYRTLDDIYQEIGKPGYIKVLDNWMPNKDQNRLIKQLVYQDRNDSRLTEIIDNLPDGKRLKGTLLNATNKNLVLSRNNSVVFDLLYTPILKAKTSFDQSVQLRAEPVVLGEILELEAPSFSQYSWKDIAKLREERPLKVFRKLIREIASSVSTQELITNPREVRDNIKREYTQELQKELEFLSDQHYQVIIKLFIGVMGGCGLIPPVLAGGIVAIPEVYKHFKSQQGWRAFISALKQ